MSLDTKTKKIVGFIRESYAMTELAMRDLVDWFKLESDRFAVILHDKDIDEHGELITPHIHFVADMKNAKRLSTFLREIADLLKVRDISVTISKYSSFELCLQYLIHKNDPDKFQYDFDDVWCSLGPDEFGLCMAYVEGEDIISYDKLKDIVMTSNSTCEIMSRINVKHYRLYRPVILDMWNEKLRVGHIY